MMVKQERVVKSDKIMAEIGIPVEESEAFYRTLAKVSPVGIFYTDGAGHCRYVNEKWCEIAGLDLEQARDDGWLAAIHPEDRDRIALEWQQLVQANHHSNSEYRFQRPDGVVTWVHSETMAINGQDGDITGYVGTITDITDRKRAEEALAAERERLSTTLRCIADGVIATDPKGNIVLINRAGEDLTGWTQEEAVGRPLEKIFQLVHEDTGEPVEVPLQAIIMGANGVAIDNQAILIARNGERRPIEEGASPLRDKDSQVMGTVLVFRDRSDRLQLESEMMRVQRLESLGVLAGGLAHDFNNFLMGINLKVNTARLRVGRDPEIQDLLASAEEAIMRAKGITQQLLTFTRGDAPVKTNIDLAPLIKEAVKFALHGTQVKPRFKLNKRLWTVAIDPGQITQVINNLVLNAVNAMPHGGQIIVSAGNVAVTDTRPKGPLAIGDYVKVSIRDTGLGIPPNIMDSIFHPYFTTREQGSGLGLFSCYTILEKHEGWITVESEVDNGSTFTFYLPGFADAVSESRATDEVLPGIGELLVVDDDQIIRASMAELLEMLNYSVDTASDGKSALAKYRHRMQAGHPFDLVILDLTIPGELSGLDIFQRLREIDSEVKAIVASGHATHPVMAHYQDYGFRGVLVKPFSAEELSRSIIEALRED